MHFSRRAPEKPFWLSLSWHTGYQQVTDKLPVQIGSTDKCLIHVHVQ